MFKNNSIFVIVKNSSAGDLIYKLEVDATTQNRVNAIFDDPAEKMLKKHKVKFAGGYNPMEDEVLVIRNFALSNQLKEAFRNPTSVEYFSMNKGELPEIRAVCIGFCESTADGEHFKAAFQRFRKNQYISTSRMRLLFDKNTFVQDNRVGLSISESVDSVFIDNDLYFTSYFFARQIFDLSSYYRTATDMDIETFIGKNVFDFGDNVETFKAEANTWYRRKIAAINDSRILENYTASKIKKLAKAHAGIDVTVKNERIIFPTDSEGAKLLLSFLDEEAWKGPFSGETFLSNSKRMAQRK